MNIVTPELVQEAIDLSLPTVRMLCKRDTWGPKGVVIAVFGKGLSTPVVYIMEELGARETWLDEGKPIDFEEIALQKLRGASREETASSEGLLLKIRGWRLRLLASTRRWMKQSPGSCSTSLVGSAIRKSESFSQIKIFMSSLEHSGLCANSAPSPFLFQHD